MSSPARPRRPLGPPAPEFLEETIEVRVRFQEVDSMAVVWHGHYLSYFEDARCALGRRYGFDYSDFAAHGCFAPVIHSELDHYAGAKMGELLTVRARLHLDQSARIDFTYRVARHADDTTLVLGRTVQVLTTQDGQLCVTRPPFYAEFVARVQDALRRS